MKAIFLLTCAISLLFTEEVCCQTTVLTMEQAISLAVENYPSIKASLAQEFAAKSEIDLAKTSYLPKMDLIWQTNRTTRSLSSTHLPIKCYEMGITLEHI